MFKTKFIDFHKNDTKENRNDFSLKEKSQLLLFIHLIFSTKATSISYIHKYAGASDHSLIMISDFLKYPSIFIFLEIRIFIAFCRIKKINFYRYLNICGFNFHKNQVSFMRK